MKLDLETETSRPTLKWFSQDYQLCLCVRNVHCRLIDGENITTSDEHMWLIPFTEGSVHRLQIRLSSSTALTGLRLWNYNKSPEDTYRGVSSLLVIINMYNLHRVPEKRPRVYFIVASTNVDKF